MKMKSGNERKKIIRELLNRTDQEFTDEELIHQLIMTNITENSNETEKLSFGQRASIQMMKTITAIMMKNKRPSWIVG